jgi:SAM-dependent methyltransferase
MPRLNVGCGNIPLTGFVNIDKFYFPDSKLPQSRMGRVAATWLDDEDSVWMYGDAVKLDFPSETFEQVMIVHCLEHLTMEDGVSALREAYRVLKTGGTLEVEVPDLLKACELMPTVHIAPDLRPNGDNKPWHRVMGLLYGDGGEGQRHLCGYTKEFLWFRLEEIGFKDIQEIPVGFGHGDDHGGHAEPEYDFRMKGTK